MFLSMLFDHHFNGHLSMLFDKSIQANIKCVTSLFQEVMYDVMFDIFVVCFWEELYRATTESYVSYITECQ